MGELTNNALSGLSSGVVGGAFNAFGSLVSSGINNQANAHYARKNARYQDKLQRDFLLDSASLEKESKRRAGISPWGDSASQTMPVSTNAQTSAPELSNIGDKAIEAKQLEMQEKLNDSAVNKNNQDAANANAQAQQTKTQTAIFANQLQEQIINGLLGKGLVQSRRSYFDKYLGSDVVDQLLNGNGIGILSGSHDVKSLITNEGQGMRYYENFVEGDHGLAHLYNTNPEFQNYLLGKEDVSIKRENAKTNRKQLAISRKQVEASLLSAKAAMRNADANMINAKVAEYLKDCQKNGIDSRTAISNVERQSLQIIQSIDRKIALAKEGPERDKLVRKKQAILNGYRTFNDSMTKWQQSNGSATAFGVVLGGVGSVMSGYGNLMRGMTNPVMQGALNPQQPVPTPSPEQWLP